MEPFCALKKRVVKNGTPEVYCDDIRSYLLERLQKIQAKEGYVSDKNMQDIADKLGIHPVEVYSVVTFYSFLTIQKKGKNIIRISDCISSQIKGNSRIIKEFEKKLKIKCGQTTKDKKITLEKTSCIGMCDKAPAALINDKLVGPIKNKDVDKIIKELK